MLFIEHILVKLRFNCVFKQLMTCEFFSAEVGLVWVDLVRSDSLNTVCLFSEAAEQK